MMVDYLTHRFITFVSSIHCYIHFAPNHVLVVCWSLSPALWAKAGNLESLSDITI